MIRHTQLESTKSDTSAFLIPSKRMDEGYFSGLFQEARVDAAQQSSSKVERRMQRDRQDEIQPRGWSSDERVSDRDRSKIPAGEDCFSEESLPSDRSDSDPCDTDRDVQDTHENTADSDEANSDENPKSSEQDTTNDVPSEGDNALAQTPNSQQEWLSGLAAQANAKTAQQQLATQQTQPQANSQPGGSSAAQAEGTPIPNQQPQKSNVQPILQQVNPPKLPEQNMPLSPTTVPTDTVEWNVESPKGIGVPPQTESQAAEEAVVKPQAEKPIHLTTPEADMLAETKKQAEVSVLTTKNPATEPNDNGNRPRPDMTSRRNHTDESIEVIVTNPDMSKKKGFEFNKQNQDQPHLTAMAKTKASVSGDNPVDLQNLPAMKSSGRVQTSDAVDRQENVDRIVRAARTAQARGTSRIQIRLEPPELGTLRIDIKQTSDGLNLQLQATSPKAQQLLQQSLNELRAALEAQGLQPRQIDIQLRLDLRDDHTPNQQQHENPSSRSGSQGQSQHSGREDFQSEPFLLWQDGQAEPESEPLESEPPAWESDPHEAVSFSPTPQWQSLEFNALDVRV